MDKLSYFSSPTNARMIYESFYAFDKKKQSNIVLNQYTLKKNKCVYIQIIKVDSV